MIKVETWVSKDNIMFAKIDGKYYVELAWVEEAIEEFKKTLNKKTK